MIFRKCSPGGDFRSLSQELVGKENFTTIRHFFSNAIVLTNRNCADIFMTIRPGGGEVATHIQEFSLFSSLGVTEIAPWLSDENNQNDGHRVHSVSHRHSLLQANDAAYIVESANYEGRINFLEEITRKLDQKVRNLETKQKEKESRNRGDNLHSGSLSELKESKDVAMASDTNKDLKTNGGGVNIERFRTLEGRQAFQQSKFSSLDIVFGGSSSSVWSKGTKLAKKVLHFFEMYRNMYIFSP